MRHLATAFALVAMPVLLATVVGGQSPGQAPAAGTAATDALSRMADEVTAEVEQIRGLNEPQGRCDADGTSLTQSRGC